MPQPVKLSDRLLSAARKVAPLANRSIAGQIEHWAVLGRMVEKDLTSSQVLAVKQGRKTRLAALDIAQLAEQDRARE